MKKALIISNIIEGFKLGSLGVSRKPKVTVDSAEEPQKTSSSPEPKPGSITTEFKDSIQHILRYGTVVTYEWFEPARLEYIKALNIMADRPFEAKITLFINTSNGLLFLVCIMNLYDQGVRDFSILEDKYFEKPLKMFNELKPAKKWFNEIRKSLEKDGLILFAFPKGWKKVS
jgi:hypothetical protein